MKLLNLSMIFSRACFLLFILLAASLTNTSSAQEKVPQFNDFQVKEQYRGKPHALVLSGDARMFRTRLREAAKGKPNFAGHYIVATWGCGSACVMGAVIDVKTGRVYMLPATLCCWTAMVDDQFNPVEFRLNSRLIIFSGARNEREGDAGAHYYKFENNRFVFLRSIKKAAED
ncbi:MAG: hypothetical protein H0W99_00960 [Acidobacteria bacterium]|nr:hypothetical protein [Acidobacteriota bacterium]